MVDKYKDGSSGSAAVQHPERNWQLPVTDLQTGGPSLTRLHTLDIYFWSDGDANSFTAILRKLLRPEQLDLPISAIPQEQATSPVVQRLENLAIQDPAYRDVQTGNSNPAISSSVPQPNAPIIKEEPPNPTNPEKSASYQLLAYNPASPPAPEKIAHREKTPPPPDGGAGTGLTAAAYRDQSHSGVSPASQPQSWAPHGAHAQSPGPHGYITAPPGQASPSKAPSGFYILPPPPPGHLTGSPQSPEYRNPGMSSSPYSPSSNPYKPGPGYTPSPPLYSGSQAPFIAPPKSSSDAPKDPKAYLYGDGPKPPDSPATEILGNSYVTGQPPLQHLQPQYADYLDSRRRTDQPPEGGYSNYQYEQPTHHHSSHSHSNKHSVHGEYYQPTEAEAHKHKHQRPAGQPAGKLEQKAEKVEKGLGRLLKKVEKKIG